MKETGVYVVNKGNNGVANKKELEDVDLDDALDFAGHGRYNYLQLLATCLTHQAAILDMLGFSIIVPAASCDLQLNLKQIGLLASVPFAGFIFALPWGYYADTRGRRRALLISTFFGFIFSALSSFSTSFYMMLVLKFLASSFSSASITLTMTYLGECTRIANRNKYLIIMSCFSMAADFVCFSLAYAFLYLDFNIPVPWLISYRPWRLYSLVLSMFLGIGTLMMIFFHESPKFLANKGETDKALDILKITYEINGGRKEDYPVRSLKGPIADAVKPTSFWDSVIKQTVPIFKPPMLWRTMQLFYLLAVCCATNNVFFMWFPTMVNSFLSSSDSNSSFCVNIVRNISTLSTDACNDTLSTSTLQFGLVFSVIITLINLATSFMASYRKIVMIITFVVAGISGILLEFINNQIIDMVLYMFLLTTGTCIGHALSYYVDVYPTSYRGLGTSLGMLLVRMVCLGGVNLVGATIVDHCDLTFIGWAVFILSGVVVALFLPADRKLGK